MFSILNTCSETRSGSGAKGSASRCARPHGGSASRPGYLVELEHGRNPTTGRAPMPSPTVLAGIGRALDVDLATLLDLAGVTPRRIGPRAPRPGERRTAIGARRGQARGARPPSTPGSRSPAAAIRPGRCGRLAEAVPGASNGDPDRRLGLVFAGEPVGASHTRGPSGDARERADMGGRRRHGLPGCGRHRAGGQRVRLPRGRHPRRPGLPIRWGPRSPSSGRILTSSSRPGTELFGPGPPPSRPS